MKSVFTFSILLFCIAVTGIAQTHLPRPNVRIASKANGYYEYLPEGYNANGTATYPLILFMTGIGEFGNGDTSLKKVLAEGIPQLIDSGIFPKSFTVNGQTHRFIVITPQFLKGSNPDAEDVDEVLNYVVSNYKVDLNRIYMTGLSYGGGLSFAYPGNNAAYAQRIAAIVPIASSLPNGGDATIQARSGVIAANGVRVWALHNARDRRPDSSTNTIAYVTYINQAAAPTVLAKMTIFNTGGHDAWTRTYNPAYRENGLNVYEWMLQYQRNIVAPNQPPVANAGDDLSITLPANSVTLRGGGTDPEGGVLTYLWTKFSGPEGGTIATNNAAETAITNLAEGSYVFQLTVTDNKGDKASDNVTVTVSPAPIPNTPPQVTAGVDQAITLPTNSLTLSGSGNDSDGSIKTFAWEKISGPDGGTIATPNTAVTNITNLQQGTYVFRLTVTDNSDARASDDVTITVNPPPIPNTPPLVSAGADKTITLPENSTTLNGTASDADGTITQIAWTKRTGPAATITNATNLITTITGLVEGSYTFLLTVTDDDGAAVSDEVLITVNPAPNKLPVANAGADISITLPANTVSLSGSGSDEDGTIVTYSWAKKSGPDGEVLVAKDAGATSVTNLVEGNYVFRLTVTDNKGATAFDDIAVTVNATPNEPPVANAGADITLTLPVNSATLSGSGRDTDGTITSYLWSSLSGPDGSTITNNSAAETVVSNLVAGTYVFRLTVSDNKGATTFDDVVITVLAAPVANMMPVANAGSDLNITLPATSATLIGSGSDADGTITGYSWTKVSGPEGGTIASPSAATTVVSGLQQGSYVFQLTVTDNRGDKASDNVTITVSPAPIPNTPPQVTAGVDQTITLPLNSITITGTATDADGTIVETIWTQQSGPVATIVSVDKASTSVTGLVQGSYTFRLTVKDDDGATATDDVMVTVVAAPLVNKVPVIDAGNNLSVTLPADSVVLTGTASDSDGTVNTYAWTQVSGPADATILSPDSSTTKVTALQQGSYIFRLTIMDNSGAIASDSVRVDVTVVTAITDPATADYKVLVAPNPATTYFSIKVSSASLKPIYLRVTDALGKTVETRTNLQRNSVITIGHTYRPGVYYAELVQNGKRLVVKLLKL